jgi:hypothetical protein
MLICRSCGKIIANVTPYPINYGNCANCPTPEEKQESKQKEKEVVDDK